MKALLIFFFSISIFAASVDKKQATSMLEKMYKKGMISKSQFEAAKSEMQGMDKAKWDSLNKQAGEVAKQRMQQGQPEAKKSKQYKKIKEKMDDVLEKLNK